MFGPDTSQGNAVSGSARTDYSTQSAEQLTQSLDHSGTNNRDWYEICEHLAARIAARDVGHEQCLQRTLNWVGVENMSGGGDSIIASKVILGIAALCDDQMKGELIGGIKSLPESPTAYFRNLEAGKLLAQLGSNTEQTHAMLSDMLMSADTQKHLAAAEMIYNRISGFNWLMSPGIDEKPVPFDNPPIWNLSSPGYCTP